MLCVPRALAQMTEHILYALKKENINNNNIWHNATERALAP